MAYIQQQQQLDGWWSDRVDDIKKAGGIAKDALTSGLIDKYTPKPSGPAPKQESFMDKYGTFIIVGGGAVAAVLAYKALRK